MENKPTTAAHLSVCIVVYNSSLEYLQRTLQSLFLSCSKAEINGYLDTVSLDIVDNSCDAAYSTQVKSLLENTPVAETFKVNYLGMPENIGFGAGNNYSINKLASKFHLVLNPDVEIAESAISLALNHLQVDEGIVLLSPRVSNEDGYQEFLCKRFPTVLVLLLRAFAPSFVRRLFQARLDDYEMRDVCTGESSVDIDLASGCFMMIRTRSFIAIGGFNKSYFLYFEDFDLSLRLRGLGRTVFDPVVEIVHHGGYASGKGFRHVAMFMRSGIRFFNTHGWRLI
ncbi:MAG: GT2 family glycosyltransferase [Halioglobus sp.]|jgi:GT2 family glycosyltransferase